MKILYVAMDAAPYSDRSHEVKVAEEMARQGHEVRLVAEREPKWSKASPKPRGLEFLGAFPVNDPAQAGAVAGALPDADVGFASSVSGAPALAVWKKRTGKPTVAQVLDVPMWRLRLRDRGPWWASWRQWFESLRSMDMVIANTQVTVGDLQECSHAIYPGTRLPRIEVVYYGLDTEEADKAEPCVNPVGTEKWLACTGRLVPYRGVDIAIQALALIPASRRPGLAVVGTGDDLERLMHLAEILEVRVAFCGGLSDNAKWSVVKACDLGIALQFNPSVPQQAPTEFVYAGKPCLVSDLPIHRERMRLSGAEAGLVGYVNPIDTREVAEAIERLIDSVFPGSEAVLDSGRAWVLGHRSFKSHAKGVLETLQRCA